jgi:Ca2+-binding RTX toxin-like protein
MKFTRRDETGGDVQQLCGDLKFMDPAPQARIDSSSAIASHSVSSLPYEVTAATVSEVHFGTIYRPEYISSLDKILESHKLAGYNFGTVRAGDLDIKNPGTDLTDHRSLASQLKLALDTDTSVSIIIPDRYYFMENSKLSEIQHDISVFLEGLLSGEFGDLPKEITLELGNESFNGTGPIGDKGAPLKYWDYLESALTAVRETLNDPLTAREDLEINIAIQTGNGKYTAINILKFVSAENLSIVDRLVMHQLNGSDEALKIDGMLEIQDFWIAQGYGHLEFDISAWNIGTPAEWTDGTGARLYRSLKGDALDNVKDIPVSELLGNDIGARQAGGSINLFTQMVALGVDAMSVWGNAAHINSYFWFTDVGGFEAVSHGGHALRLMNESLIGTKLLDGKVETVTELDGTKHAEWSQDHGSQSYDAYTYQDTAKQVIFLTADDINSEGMSVKVDFGTFNAQYAWAEIIRTDISPEHKSFLRENGLNDAYDRLFETPTILRIAIPLEDGKFTYHFEQDYEVARVILVREAPEYGFVHLWGTSVDDGFVGGQSGDLLEGNSGNDTLYGMGGNDTLFGGSENDKIFGGAGSDTIYAGAGSDTLEGGAGADVFIVGSTTVNDMRTEVEIWDFNSSEDTLLVAGIKIDVHEKTNLPPELTSSRTSLGDLMLKFGEGNTVILRGVDAFKEPANKVIGSNSDDIINISYQGKFGASVTDKHSKKDVILGFGGNDTIIGYKGSDIIKGGTGNDYLNGDRQNNKIFGQNGDDILLTGRHSSLLIGGNGDDMLFASMALNVSHTLKGGKGADTFVFSSPSNSHRVEAIVKDFDINQDKLIFQGEQVDLFDTSTFVAGVSLESDKNGNLLLAFGDDDSITLEGIEAFDFI